MAEITDHESFKSWLEGKPVEWAQVLAMRAALRVLPRVGQVFDVANSDNAAVRSAVYAANGAYIAVRTAVSRGPS